MSRRTLLARALPLGAAGMLMALIPAAAVQAATPVTTPGYTLTTFVVGTSTLTHPDPIVVDGADVYIAYQNATPKDGTFTLSSSVVHYRNDGTLLGRVEIPGHVDGMRKNPTDGKIWASVNEDSHPRLYVITFPAGTLATYNLPDPPPHGTAGAGGYDDILFTPDGTAYIAASNPGNATNTFPAIGKVTLVGPNANVTGVLNGNASATDIATGGTVTLNLQDPDSMTLDPQGDLVLISQGDGQAVFVRNPGASQAVFVLNLKGNPNDPLTNQVDDTVWGSGLGRLMVVDGANNATYMLRTDAGAGTLFTQTPDQTPLSANTPSVSTVSINRADPTILGAVSAASVGTITPVVTGFGKPTGMWWVPDSAAWPAPLAASTSPSPVPSLPRAGQARPATGAETVRLVLLALAGALALGLILPALRRRV